MRVVLDTNVIIPGLLFGGVPEKVVREVLAGKAHSVTSPYIIEETSRILKSKFGIDELQINMLQQLLSSSEMQFFQPYLSIIGDDPDNRILETAETGKADYVVTGDKLLLELGQYKTIKIVKPADFLVFVKQN
jgi:putative PIN family toxin of toxin-antitoxin system